MLSSARYINRSTALCALVLLSQRIAGTGFVPRDISAGETITPRGCDPATPDVSESSIIANVCDQNLANDSSTCSDEMTSYMQKAANNTCGQYFGLFADCLTANNHNHTACSDAHFGYQDCHNYTMQAYAYCGCYYTIPASLADCANEQLQPQAQVTGTVPPTSTPATAITTTSDMVAIAANTTENPTPPAAALSGVPSPLSTQSTVPISNPAFPNASTIRLASLNPTTPSHDPNTPWTPNAAPATSPEPLTIMLTYTTTLTAAGYTTTATLTSASISTLYTCPDDSDITFPAPAPTPSALTRPPPIGLAPVVSEPLTPLSATVLALSTGAGIGQGTTEYRPSRSPSISISSATAPFVAPSPLSSGVGISGTTAGRNASKVCAACGRRSKIF